MRDDFDDERLADFFKPGVDPADIAALHPLQRARATWQAMQGLFNGAEPAVLMRLLVLREVAARGGEPFWTAAELRARFPYLDEAKLEHLIGRLRVHGLLAWDAESARYALSPVGRMLVAALAGLLSFGGDEDADLGYLAGQLAGSGAVGRVGQDELQHLLSRLVALKREFEAAILSASESRIRAAERRLQAVWPWVDKGSEVLRRITEDAELDGAAHRLAQHIGQVQSELLRMSGAFQRALNQLEAQRVHLGASGLSSSDVGRWLRTLSVAQLAGLADGAAAALPEFSFALGDIALDVAEYELIDKLRPERIEVALPPAAAAPPVEAFAAETPDWGELERWRDELLAAPDGTALAEAVPLRDYALSSYRLSLLTLLGDRESLGLSGPVAELARIARHIELGAGVVRVGRDGVAEMSEGALRDGKPRKERKADGA